jgi:hypothetical protein
VGEHLGEHLLSDFALLRVNNCLTVCIGTIARLGF